MTKNKDNKQQDIDTLTKADELFEQKKYTEAEKLAIECLAEEKENGEVLALLAHIYVRQNKYKEAREYATKALKNGSNARAFLVMGDLYSNTGENDRAIEYYNEVIKVAPKYVLAYIKLGKAYNKQNNESRAIEYYQKALEIDPKNRTAYVELGRIYLALSDYDKAAEYYVEAIEIDPKDPEADTMLAEISGFESAQINLILYKKIIVRHPDDIEAHIKLGSSYLNQNDYKMAFKSFRKAIEIDPLNITAYIKLGSAYSQKKDIFKARQCYQEAIRIDPNNAEAHFYIGNDYVKEGDYDEAIKSFRKAKEIDPKDAFVCIKLGEAYSKIENYSNAYECYQKAIEIDPTDRFPYVVIGWNYIENSDYAKAKEFFEKALQIDPTRTWLYYSLAEICCKLKDYTKAIEYCRQVIEIGPIGIVDYVLLGRAFIGNKDTLKAIDAYLKGIELSADKNLTIALMSFPGYEDDNIISSMNKVLDRISINYKEAHYGFGLLDMFQGSYQRAINSFSNDGSIYSNIASAVAKIMLGKYDEANKYIHMLSNETNAYPIPVPILTSDGLKISIIGPHSTTNIKHLLNIIIRGQKNELTLDDVNKISKFENSHHGTKEFYLFMAYCWNKMNDEVKKKQYQQKAEITVNMGQRGHPVVEQIGQLGQSGRIVDNTNEMRIAHGCLTWDINLREADNTFSMSLWQLNTKKQPYYYKQNQSAGLIQRFKELEGIACIWPQQKEELLDSISVLREMIVHDVERESGIDGIFETNESVIIAVDKRCGQFPWELVSRTKEREPFCIHTTVTRQVPNQIMDESPVRVPLKMLLIAGAFDKNTKNADSECAILKKYLNDDLGLQDSGALETLDLWNIDDLEKYKRKSKLLTDLMDYDVVHYTGHGSLSHDEGWSGLQVRRNTANCDSLLSGWDICTYINANQAKTRKPALFFLNACNTGEGLEGRGVGYDIVRAGIRCCIGTFWKIDDEPEPMIAKEFYRCFLKDQLPYGESFRRARALAYKNGHKSWTQYAAYGNPMIRVQRSQE